MYVIVDDKDLGVPHVARTRGRSGGVVTVHTLFARLYEYRVDAPGRPEHGRVIRFDGRTCPAMHQREPYTLADGTMAHIDYIGPVQP